VQEQLQTETEANGGKSAAWERNLSPNLSLFTRARALRKHKKGLSA
jgi:hypothetical protein